MTDTSDILQYQQGVEVAAPPDGFEQVTSPLNPGLRTANRFAHFSSDVYDLSPESHLSKLLKVFLGDAGVGQVQKRMMLARIQASLGGTNFFDLDAFYGAIFGAQRSAAEVLEVNPHIDMLTPDEWEVALLRDGSFRSRASRLASAIHLGATVDGLKGVAEAMIGATVDVHEQWQISGDLPYGRTWESLEAFTWDDLEAFTWDELEVTDTDDGNVIEVPYNAIHIYPHVRLSAGAMFDVERSLDRLKPAGSSIVVHEGIESMDMPVPAKAFSDSEFWEIRSQVRNVKGFSNRILLDGEEGQFQNLAKPPWSWYSGEAWTHLVEDPSVVTYMTPGTPSLAQNVDAAATMLTPQRYTTFDGRELVYLPSYALRPVQGVFSGRMVSDGILASHPYDGLRRAANSSVGKLTSDGMVVGDFIDYISLPPNRKGVQFWTSPPRMFDDPTADTLEVRFDSSVMVNHISFEHASFPCSIVVQAWTVSSGWVTIFSRNHRRANPYGLSGSVPNGETNPYHFGSGHWVQVKEGLEAISSKSFRLVFVRQSGWGPVGSNGKPVPYPVGVRNFDLGYRISNQGAIPNLDPSEPIVTTVNPFGLPVQHFINRHPAERVLDDLESFWQCEPQPIADAAINIYLDLRDGHGNPQAVDRLYVDPVHTGPTYNLYWSDTDPTGNPAVSPSKESPLVPPLTGSVTLHVGGDGGISLASGTPVHFDFSNKTLHFDPSLTWTFAAQVYSFFGSGQGKRFAILSAGSEEEHAFEDVGLVWDDEDGTMSLRVGDRIGTVTLTENVAVNSRVSIVGTHLQDGTISLAVIHPSGTVDDAVVTSTYGDDEMVNTSTGRMVPVTGALSTDGMTVASAIGATVPSTEFTQPTTEFDLSFWYKPTDSWSPASNQTLISIEGAGDNAFRVQSMPSGNLRLSLSQDGTAWVENSRAIAGVDGVGMWLRLRWDTVSNNASIWTAAGAPEARPADAAWTQAGADFTLSITSIFTSASPLSIGSATAAGTIGRVVLASAVGGTPTVDINFVREVALDSTVVRVGCSWADVPLRITRAVLTYGAIDPEDFVDNTDAYTRLPRAGGQRMETYGAIIRFHPDYHSWYSPEGFCWGWMGGTLDMWDSVHWKPLAHNVRVEKGNVDFPIVLAKFLKAEFTNLVAQPYDALLASQRPVQKIRPYNRPTKPGSGNSNVRSRMEQSVLSVSGRSRYADSPRISTSPDPSVNGVSPTAAITPFDQRNRATLSMSSGFTFGVLPWQPGHTMPINDQSGMHSYDSMLVESINKVAFFIGLRTFKPKRTIPAVQADTRQYFETFLDANGIDQPLLTMNSNPGHIYTPESASNALMPSSMKFEGKTHFSRMPIVGVQLATHQSGPFQIIPDDEFSDPSLSASTFSSTDKWHASGDGNLIWDAGASTVKVTRDPSEVVGIFTPDTPLVHPPVSPVVASGYGESETIAYDTFGGITSPLVQTSPRGTIFIGTRVTALTELSSPLFLRVYGNDNATVLAEEEFTPDRGVPVEVTVAYVVGSSDLDNAIQVRIEQDGPYADSWLVHSLSAFDDSVLWEVSNDGGATWLPVLQARNLVYGAVMFPGPGAALRWRATAYRYNTVIDTVNARPWYSMRTGSE